MQGTLHWVSAAHAVDAEARMYEQLFARPNPEDYPEGADYKANLNPNSMTVLTGCKAEPALADVTLVSGGDNQFGDGIRAERRAWWSSCGPRAAGCARVETSWKMNFDRETRSP